MADFERLGWGKAQKRVSGLEAVQDHRKLMIWGKPGAGKTTFLKYIAMECLAERLGTDFFPIFLSLKEFAEKPGQPELLHYISHKFEDAGVKAEIIEKLLSHGKAFGSPLFCVITHAYGLMESFHSNPFAVIFSRLVISMTHFPHS